MKRFKLTVALLVVLALTGWYYSFPRANPFVQKQSGRYETFLATKPDVKATLTFLTGEKMGYSHGSREEIFTGNTASEYQLAHKAQIGSEIGIRLSQIEYPFCGFTDQVVIVSYDRQGRFLNVDSWKSNHGCLDF